MPEPWIEPLTRQWQIVPCTSGYLIENAFRERIVRGAGGIREIEYAQLIAAAPDLLAACQMAHDYLTGKINEGGILATLEAALAKAKGVQDVRA